MQRESEKEEMKRTNMTDIAMKSGVASKVIVGSFSISVQRNSLSPYIGSS